MKPSKSHLFKSTPSIAFGYPKPNRNFASLHSLVSDSLPVDFATETPPASRLRSNPILVSSSLNPRKNQSINTHFPDSPKQSNPIIRTTFLYLISSPKHHNNEPINNHLLDPFKQSKPVVRTPFCNPMLCKFTHSRPFSTTTTSETFAKTLASTECNSSSFNPIPGVATVNSPDEFSRPIDAGSTIRKPISLWPGMYHSPVTNALWEARSSIFERPSNVQNIAPTPTELITKTPSQSRTSIFYKFSSDYILREQYRNPWNEIRVGKLVEDLDALAGTISFKHSSNADSTTRPLLLVTASVDRMVMKKTIHIDIDLEIVGAVTWVGRSSMEIQLKVIQSTQEMSNPSDSVALVANFTFVARDSMTGRSALVNQISPVTDEEKALWEEAEERNKLRKKKKGENKKVLDDREIDRLEEMLAEGRVFRDMPALADRDSILMSDTCLQNSLVCQPQQRNIHGRIFGGFLMRRAFELAFSTAYAFAGGVPCFLEVDRVDFLRPVDVGNFLHFKSCVLFTELKDPAQPLINVEVVAHVTRPELRSSEVSNKFYFTFSVRSEAMKDGMRVRNVVPSTEEEARRVIERMDAECP